MRSISIIITEVIALLPDPSTVPEPYASNVPSLKAELISLQRKALYAAPEDTSEWSYLTNLLNRYLPTPSATSGYTWAQSIALLVRGL